jgi:hypothetical protein
MAALPALGSGLRMAAAVAPIGAIIGEWVGSAEGLGYVMLNANARMQTDVCFAAVYFSAADHSAMAGSGCSVTPADQLDAGIRNNHA